MTPRSIWTVIASFAIGPGFGGLSFIVLSVVTDSLLVERPRGPTVAGMEDYWPAVMIGAYVLGAIPGIVSAAIMIVLTRWLPHIWQRLLVAALVGAVVSLAGLSFLILSDASISDYDLMIGSVIMASGALAAVASLAVVELFHPLPPRAKA